MSTSTVDQFTLANGLRLVTAPAATGQVAAVNLWYGVGSRHERAGRTGFAHLFEHLMFQGSANVPKGGHFEAIERLGGDLNATTSTDRTNYYETVPEHGLDLALWLEADRLGTLREGVTQDVLDNQRDVVKNERRERYDNQPYGTAVERLFANAYPAGHPYHHSVIGSMADLDAATLDDVLDFHRQHYGPDNAVLTVVSSLEPEDVRDRVERFFGGLAARTELPEIPDPSIAPRRDGEVRETVVEPCPAPGVFLAYRVGELGSREYDVSDVLGAVLGRGQGSRLYRRLVVERGLAVDTGGYGNIMNFSFRHTSSLLVVNMLARDGVSGDTLEKAILDELAAAADGVTEEEVERARAVLERDHLQSLASPGGLADALSSSAQMFDDPRAMLDWPERWASIGPEDVAALAADALAPSNRLALRFEPEEVAA